MADEVSVEEKSEINWRVFGLSGGFFVLFVIASIINLDAVSSVVDACFNWSISWFGAFWQVLVLLTFIIAVLLGISKYGSVRLGGDEPEINTFNWIAMIMCALLAGGGVFWSAAEPMYHFLDTPAFFSGSGVESATAAAVNPAFSYSFLHWGFLAWAILGTLGTIVLMDGVYRKELPLQPRSLLYPVVGENGVFGLLGDLADITSILAVAAGTIGPIGFLGLQLSYALEKVLGIPDVFMTQLGVILAFTAFYTITAILGLEDGIQKLSDFTARFTLLCGLVILIFGPGSFIINHFLSGYGTYLDNFFSISLFRGDANWLSWWTSFFWAWFIGYAPMMAIFVARISRGRTIREIILAVAVISPVVTNFWFSIVGGTGIFYELQNPGVISESLNSSGMAAALLDIIEMVPYIGPNILMAAILYLIVGFLATTGNSMAYTMSMVVTAEDVPPKWVRAFWSIAMGAVAAILMKIGGVNALQRFIVVTAVPVSVFMIPTLWAAPKTAAELYEKQNNTVTTSSVPKDSLDVELTEETEEVTN
ncbi:BCCT family transporter [Acetohalobium arabaticum]|uniref:BCCT transporter n=1 Tax=Acetohalobium arabaticum (strain ATCC 49924 / DSM 5501 / Z-7288) TaxID=574087 RepID=D9QUT0_ACEAZ|nr:BCCT family transporter [Acetohalobium arabaticum]ADL11989.1 BCCT transporter [Acetohalobium arabaticum DSM 5501]